MKTRIAAMALALALGGCAGTPTWDESVFPNQVKYGGQSASAVAQTPPK
jgi:hypothetical protein